MNDNGKVVLTRDVHIYVGLNSINISNRSKLFGGNYKVQVVSGGDICNQEFVVL